MRKKILLISNYKKDAQKSMLKFASSLTSTSSEQFEIEEISPSPIFGKLFSNSKMCKWAGYIDKFILFPNVLKSKLQKKTFKLVHIADHSNSYYLKAVRHFEQIVRLITCHDLIAIKSHLGYFNYSPKLSYTGHRLQSLIFKSLQSADYWVCDSMQTKKDVNHIIPQSIGNSMVIHLGTNFDNQSYVGNFNIKSKYILHVGSDAWYKNRGSVLNTFRFLKEKNTFHHLELFFVGPKLKPHELDSETKQFLTKYRKSIKVFENISNDQLVYLYENALLLLFPSFTEGFGWPPIEAAFCGCQVITSPHGAIKDILKADAHYIDAENQNLINETTLAVIQKPKKISSKIQIPNESKCRASYFKLYKTLIEKKIK